MGIGLFFIINHSSACVAVPTALLSLYLALNSCATGATNTNYNMQAGIKSFRFGMMSKKTLHWATGARYGSRPQRKCT